jgi:Type IV conjugative transfer system lipoprotein (TraV)
LIKFAIVAVLVCFLQACATADPKPVLDPVTTYKKGMGEGTKSMVEEVRKNLKQKNAYGYVEPYYPVRLPPDIRRVWIVDHQNDAGDLIQGHWVFMVVTPGRWGSPAIPAVHPDRGDKTTSAIPVIEEKPAPPSSGTQGKVNDSKGE